MLKDEIRGERLEIGKRSCIRNCGDYDIYESYWRAGAPL